MTTTTTTTVTRIVPVHLAAGLATVLLAAGCTGAGRPPAPEQPTAPGPAPSSLPPPQPFPPPGKVFLGIQTNAGAYDFAALDAFVGATGAKPSVMQFSQGWEYNQFDPGVFERIAARNMLPIVSWEPWDYQLRGEAQDNGVQPRYRLARIIAGEFDTYIRSWAQGLAALPHPVVMRFGHEMNGFWYPWCQGSNGNKAGDYVKAWRHVHGIFAEAKADNVTWLWSPNVTYAGAAPLKDVYPGDEYVDWIGLSGYYGTAGTKNYRSFDSIFTNTFTELATITTKPVVITETGATNAQGWRERWVQEMFTQLPRHPQVIGVIWFEAQKELDWRLASTPGAAKAFGQNAAQERYQTPWTIRGIPRV